MDFLKLMDADLSVDRRRIKVGVTQKLLNVADVCPTFQHVRCARVTKQMTATFSDESGFLKVSGD